MACGGCTTEVLAQAGGGVFFDMNAKNPATEWPPTREFGWTLKQEDATTFDYQYHPNTGQFVVIANFPLVRGVTCEMIYWWFKYLPNLKVRLRNVGNYTDGDIVPAYHLWHPCDHFRHPLIDNSSNSNSNNNKSDSNSNSTDLWTVGRSCDIVEAFSYDRYERKYMVNSPMEMWYLRDGPFGGQGMGIRSMGMWIMSSRIVWAPAKEGECEEEGKEVEGVHVHYEMTGGLAMPQFCGILPSLQRHLIGKQQEEILREWRRHGSAEFGIFENMLPTLYKQRHHLEGKPTSEWVLDYDAMTDDTGRNFPTQLRSCDPSLVGKRMKEYMACDDTIMYLRTTQALGDCFYSSE